MNKSLIVIVLCTLLSPVLLSASSIHEATPYQRTITKEFTVSSGSTLNIENKYGNVTLHSWNKNQIQAVIKVKADASTLDAAKQLANQVAIKSSQSGNTVTLQTQYDSDNGGSFWKSFFGGSTKTGKRNIHIDYEVYVPQSLAGAHIKNNYGNVTGDNIAGNMTLDMNYGAFHISNLTGTLNLNSNYCEGNLNGIKTSRVRANYTNFNLDKINKVSIQSNYSDYKIVQVGDMEIDGNYGDITADGISSIDGKTTYSDYKINTLSSGGNINTTYGDIYIKMLGNQFNGLNISPTYSDIKIGMPDNLSVKLDIHLTHGDIHTGNLSLQTTERTEQHGNSVLRATTKGAGNSTPTIKIDGSYADVSLTGK